MTHRLIEHLFFFGLLGVSAYLMWEIIAPFAGMLVLSAILVVLSYPAYIWIQHHISPRKSRAIAALLSIALVVCVVLLPLTFVGYLLFSEALSFYNSISEGSALSFTGAVNDIEAFIQQFVPAFDISISQYANQVASWFSSHVQGIFASTLSTVFLLFLSFIALYYFFVDGKEFTRSLIKLSPLPDADDEQILRRLAQAVRSVVVGILAVALAQGFVTAIGLAIFGFEQAVLLGSVAAIGALIPAIGTSIVFIPAVAYLVLTGSYLEGVGLALWGMLAVGLIDNLLGPYIMSRKVPLHPFLILLSVLGGIAFFGPIGFILGPVVLSFFTVLLELYNTHLTPSGDMDL